MQLTFCPLFFTITSLISLMHGKSHVPLPFLSFCRCAKCLETCKNDVKICKVSKSSKSRCTFSWWFRSSRNGSELKDALVIRLASAKKCIDVPWGIRFRSTDVVAYRRVILRGGRYQAGNTSARLGCWRTRAPVGSKMELTRYLICCTLTDSYLSVQRAEKLRVSANHTGGLRPGARMIEKW